jgi:hypothetical protein
MTSSYRVGFSCCQWPSINRLLTIRSQSPDLTALTQCTSWCVYLMVFVMRQPSARSTPPVPVDPRLDDRVETEAAVRWMAGRSSNAGTLEKGLTEMRPSLVSSDIKLSSEHYVTAVQTRFPRSSTAPSRFTNAPEFTVVVP